MKKEEISYRTKRKLADALKRAMEKKSFESITVTSLLEECDITRSTFYYHFKDIYDLMIWMFDQEAVALMEYSRDAETWSDGMLLVFRYVTENAAVCRCALSNPGVGREYLRRFCVKGCQAVMMCFIDSLNIPAREEHRQFIARFYTQAMVSPLIDWLESGMRQTPEEMIALYDIAMRGAVREALLRSASEK